MDRGNAEGCKPPSTPYGNGNHLLSETMEKQSDCAMISFKNSDDSQVIVERACSKLNKVLLPFLLLFSVIASIDRANLGFASIDLSAEIGLSAEDYGLGAGIFFLSYSLFQVPCNILFLYTGGPILLGLIAVAWGVAAAAQAAITGRTSFLIVRLFLGLAEAGTVPGIWAYVAHVYPASHLTLPTTFYMAGITAAQAIGAPLAAGLLSLHGSAGLSGWRWLFIIEGIPSVLLGLAIFAFLPRSVAHCKWLSEEEKRYTQLAIDASHMGDGLPAVQCEGAVLPQAAGSKDSKPSAKAIAADFAAALQHKVVWCAGSWRFLYALTLNGLIYFTPLIVNSMVGAQHATGAPAHSSSMIMLLTAVPYTLGVITHIANGYHSKKVNEKRYHIAALWLWGGVVMCVMPVAWSHNANQAAFALLVLACMGVMGCDGVDISWIISLMQTLTPSQRVLGMASLNTLANFGSFTGPYLLGYLKTTTGQYYAGCWLMGGAVVAAAVCVACFPLKWAGQPKLAEPSTQQQQPGDASEGPDKVVIDCSQQC